ncbi:tail fiber assembly protein [Enterobacter adelaidei]
MGYIYRASTGGFYNDELEAVYRKAGTWPGFFVRVTDEDYQTLMKGVAQGKRIVPDQRCYPVLADQIIDWGREAEDTRKRLLDEAATITSDMKTELQLGIISDQDKITLAAWMTYVKQLRAMDLTTIKDKASFALIDWPMIPF